MRLWPPLGATGRGSWAPAIAPQKEAPFPPDAQTRTLSSALGLATPAAALQQPAPQRYRAVAAGDEGAPLAHLSMPPPERPERPGSAVVLLHGTGDDEFGLLPIGAALQAALKGSLVLSCRAPLAFPGGGGYRHFEGYSFDPAPAALEHQVAEAADRALEMCAWARRRHGVDKGGQLDAAVCSSGVLLRDFCNAATPLGRELRPAAEGVGVLATHGTLDGTTPYELHEETVARAEALLPALRVTRITRPDGHNVVAQQESVAWLAEALGA